MLRHTLTIALEQIRTRVAAGYPSLGAAARTLRLSEKARAELDKLLDAVRFDATPEHFDKPFGEGQPAPPREVAAWREACAEATRAMVPPSIGGLGLTAWEDVGELTRLEVVGLLTLALQRLAHTPEVGAGPLFPGLRS
ncbi:hypothetical protein ACLESD_08660 [Pyxidicoccus sp. 3LFB2]